MVRAPSAPPNAASSGRLLDVPHEVAELGAHRVAGERDIGPGDAGKRRGGARAEPHADAVREPGHGVLFVHDTRDPPEPRRDDARQRRVAAEPDDDTRPVAPHDAERAHERDERLEHDADVGEREPALQAAPRQEVDREAGVGDDAAFEPALAADEVDRRRIVAARGELLRERERGIDVSARAAAGEEREGRLAHRPVRRAAAPASMRAGRRAATGGRRWRGCPRRPS